jgi:hypothetical protein
MKKDLGCGPDTIIVVRLSSGDNQINSMVGPPEHASILDPVTVYLPGLLARWAQAL